MEGLLNMKRVLMLALLLTPIVASSQIRSPDVEAARIRLDALGARLQQEDPDFRMRYPLLLRHVDAIRSNYPPSQWAAQAERVYWALPGAADIQRASGPIPLTLSVGRPPPCAEMEEERSSFEAAARELLQCAGSRDYRDDCSSESNAARDAAERYEAAVQSPEDVCDR
jgi:hypothetical protein